MAIQSRINRFPRPADIPGKQKKGFMNRNTTSPKTSRTWLVLSALLFTVPLLSVMAGCVSEPPAPDTEFTAPVQTLSDAPVPEIISPVESCVLLGDSITARGDFTPYFPAVTLYNLGISGDTIDGVTERMNQAVEIDPDLLLILCGINSLTDGTLEQCIAEYDLLAAEAAKTSGETRVVIQSVLPIDENHMKWKPCSDETIRAFNDAIRAIAVKYGFDYLDLYTAFAADNAMNPDLTSDGLHLNEDGYDLWADLIRPYMDGRS